MASSSVSHSESHSDTYIPEYSETPILQAIALQAKDMAGKVYDWGLNRFNRMQGDIDGLMRDALSYASPQRIAVDMGMAEAGVQQAAERGRLSAIRDMESYGIDPSAGKRFWNPERVMTAAAAAGAGNQQRMASQAAGNAMRNQAIAAGLQNANFGLGVGDSANRFLQTASSLKYPPLGRFSDSVSDSASGSTDGGGGSKPQQPKEEKPPQQQQEKPPPQARPQAPAKAQPTKDKAEKKKPKEEEEKEEPEENKNWNDPDMSDQGRRQPELRDPDLENMQPPPLTDPDLQNMQPPPLTDPDLENMQPPPLRDPDLENMQPPPGDTMVDSGYDPYAGNVREASFTDGQIDPVTGQPIETTEDTSQDVAGSLYGLEGGDWTLEGAAPTAADWGEGVEQASFGDAPEGQVWDSAYDTYTDDQSGAQFELGDYQEPAGEEPIDVTNTGGGDTGDFTFDYGDQGDQGDQGDEGQWDYDYTDEGDYDYGDEGDQGDYDYEDDYDYDASADEDYSDDYEYTDYSDEGDEGDYDDSSDDSDYEYEDDSDDGGDYARGGPVRPRGGRGMPGSRPRSQMATGYRPMQNPGRRMDPPPQPPRPPRGEPIPARGGPRPPPMGRGMGGPGAMMPGNFISPNGMPPPVAGGAPRPQMMARGGQAGGRAEPTRGGFVSNELSPSGGSKVDDVEARLNAGEFVIPKDVAHWKGKEFFYKLIAQARKARSGGGQPQKAQTGYGAPR